MANNLIRKLIKGCVCVTFYTILVLQLTAFSANNNNSGVVPMLSVCSGKRGWTWEYRIKLCYHCHLTKIEEQQHAALITYLSSWRSLPTWPITSRQFAASIFFFIFKLAICHVAYQCHFTQMVSTLEGPTKVDRNRVTVNFCFVSEYSFLPNSKLYYFSF